jgi:O-antigen/teichoic acid export membrane protein
VSFSQYIAADFINKLMSITQVRNLLGSQIGRQLSLVLVGNLFAASLGALAIFIISRNLPVSDFGLFNTARSLMLVAVSFTDLGTSTTMISFASTMLGKWNRDDANEIFIIAFLVRLTLGILSLFAIYKFSEFLSVGVFGYSSLTPLFKIAAFGVLFLSLLRYLGSVFETKKLFHDSVFLNLVFDVSKVGGVTILVFYALLNVESALAVFAFTSIVAVIFGFPKIRSHIFLTFNIKRRSLKELFSFSKWIFFRNISAMTIPYVGVFMLTKFLDSSAAGLYSLAYSLTFMMPILIGSIGKVLLPEVSRFKELDEFRSYMRKILKLSICLVLLTVPVFFVSDRFITFFFGTKYLGTAPIFNLLLLSSVFMVFNSAIVFCLYPLNKPNVIAVQSISKLIALVVGCYILIPKMGAISPAILLLFLNVITSVTLYIYVYKRVQREKVNVLGTHIGAID